MQPIDCVRCGKDRMAIIMSKAMAALDIGTLEASASGDAHHGGGVSHIILWSMVVDGGRWHDSRWWSIMSIDKSITVDRCRSLSIDVDRRRFRSIDVDLGRRSTQLVNPLVDRRRSQTF